MTRRPLRPLARILQARARGENPDAIERENRRQRHEALRDRDRLRAQNRLLVMGVFFCCAFALVGARMAVLATSEPVEPRRASGGPAIQAARADIVDREGRLLATNLATQSLYAQPRRMIAPERTAADLAEIFPELDAAALGAQFTGDRAFLWVKKTISPEQRQKVHDIGSPGLGFGPREMRLYPNGRLAAHVLGGASFGRESTHSAEVVGVAGIEAAMEARLRDPARTDEPLRLSIDLPAQAAMREVLWGGIRLLGAKGAAAIVMDARTGEIRAMTSLPDFDPNDRPRERDRKGDGPLFNRAVQGLYELGSTFKPLTAAHALDAGLVNPGTVLQTKGPLVVGRHRIRDYRNYGDTLSVTDVIVKSSNIGTARMAMMIGGPGQKAFLGEMGLLAPLQVELIEARRARPLSPARWTDIHTTTISYGHGISTSPLHLAQAYATLVNGGERVRPTLLAGAAPGQGARVISETTSAALRSMLGEVVGRGTASFAQVEGYAVGGKTGTADKPKPTGGYYDDRVIATFAGAFPIDDPEYVLVVMLDEPQETSGETPRRTAGWTAVPVAAELVRRMAPILGVRPQIEPPGESLLTVAATR